MRGLCGLFSKSWALFRTFTLLLALFYWGECPPSVFPISPVLLSLFPGSSSRRVVLSLFLLLASLPSSRPCLKVPISSSRCFFFWLFLSCFPFFSLFRLLSTSLFGSFLSTSPHCQFLPLFTSRHRQPQPTTTPSTDCDNLPTTHHHRGMTVLPARLQ